MRVFVLLSLGLNALAATVSLKWDVGYVSADPDKSGHSRRVIGINGKWPPPQINVNLGDQVRVELTNKLNDWNTTLHWHGIRQKGSGNYDGPEYVTQCPIPPNDVMVYNFPVRRPPTPTGPGPKKDAGLTDQVDQSTGHLLVSLPRGRTVSRWLSWGHCRS